MNLAGLGPKNGASACADDDYGEGLRSATLLIWEQKRLWQVNKSAFNIDYSDGCGKDKENEELEEAWQTWKQDK